MLQPRASSSPTRRATTSGSTEISARPNWAPGECSSRRSSMLTPTSPISVSSRPSSPGRSSTMTTIWLNRWFWPCLPGRRSTPTLPPAIVSASARRAPGAVGSLSAPITCSRSPGSRGGCRRRPAEFAPRIWIHSSGSLAAIRVVSRTPCPARRQRAVGCRRRAARRAGSRPAAARARPARLPGRAPRRVISTGIAPRSRARSSISAELLRPASPRRGRSPRGGRGRGRRGPRSRRRARARPADASRCSGRGRRRGRAARRSGPSLTLATSVTTASG